MNNRLRGQAHQIWNLPFGRCLAPEGTCALEPIKAHSVQKQGPLRRLASANQHVVMLQQRFDRQHVPTIDFGLVGINKATVFTGLCSKHDQALFEPIDRNELDIGNHEHLFLYAYRAVLRETHVSSESGAKLQGVYRAKGDLGLINTTVPTRDGILALERMILAYETWMYKTAYDEAFVTRRFDDVVYDCLDLGKVVPSIAVSSLFSIDDVIVDDDVARVALSVVPSANGHSYALLAYLRRDSAGARAWLRPLLTSEGQQQRYLLSRMILERCENVAINPLVYDSWSQEKRNIIRDFFASTILENNRDFQDSRLGLFETPMM